MAKPISAALEPVFASQQMQRALHEAAWAARILLHVDASVIFLAAQDHLMASAWHGREAGGVSIGAESWSVKTLSAGRRSITWDRLDRCPDSELVALLDGMGLLSGLVVPLSANGNLIGMWLAASARERSFQGSSELIMSTLASNIDLTTESLLLSAENLRYRREADALYEIGQEISQLRDLNQVLRVIAQKTCSLLNAEISYIALADDRDKVVRVHTTEGTRNDFLRTMVLKYGEGVGGYVASTGKPLLVDNYPKDPRPKPPGIAYIAATEDIVSIISVPMLTRRGLIGVLFAASRREAVFHPSQVDLACALGTQAAIAIENATLYEEQKVAADKLRASMTTNEQFLSLVLGNRGMQAIADTLSELVRSPVAVQDNYFHVVCTSTRGCPEAEAKQLLSSQHLASRDLVRQSGMRSLLDVSQVTRHAVRFPPCPESRTLHSRVVARIIAGNELLGYVSVVELEQALNEQQQSAVEQASIVLALEFLKQEATQDVEQRLAGDLLDDLILGRSGPDTAVVQRAARFHVDLHLPHRLMVADIDGFAQAIQKHHWTDMEALAVKRRFIGIVNDVIRRDCPGSLVGSRQDSVLMLVPERTGQNLSGITGLARALQQTLRVSLPDVTVSIGIGRLAQKAADIPQSHSDATMALHTGHCVGKTNCVVAFEELGVMPLLLQSGDQHGLMGFVERYLTPLLAYDAEHQAELVPTLQAYLVHSGNLRRTAADCHVHLNSLKYRIRRIREITGLDLEDGETRFNLHLALSIRSALNILQVESGS